MENEQPHAFRKTLIRSLLLVLALMGASTGQSSTPGPVLPLTVSLRAEKTVVKLGSDMVANVALTNVSQHPVMIPMSLNTRNGETGYLVSLKDNAGKPVPETPYYRKFKCAVREGPCVDDDPSFGLTSNFIEGPLPPGSSWPMEIHLMTLFAITEPGTYTLQAEWGDAKGRAIPVGARIRSNKLTITVQP
jgi:hypothetical protein